MSDDHGPNLCNDVSPSPRPSFLQFAPPLNANLITMGGTKGALQSDYAKLAATDVDIEDERYMPMW